VKWAVKLIAKLFLSRVPLSYSSWTKLGVFRHGSMDSAEYALRIFDLHQKRAYPNGLPKGARIAEIGPGDSIASALIATHHGVRCTLLIDAGDFARTDLRFYKELAEKLQRRGMHIVDISRVRSFPELLEACSARYLTDGLRSLAALETHSLDYVWSHSVLEHVRKAEVAPFIAELKRVMRPGSYSSHNIDFQDHLDHALNNLRFSEGTWESSLFASSGFYTNRIPACELHHFFEEYGFLIRHQQFGRWSRLPTPRSAMHSAFAKYSDEDLLNRTSHILVEA
jgi:hypothetical protein